jgi:two-component system KDP operon response regulator KdpE
MLVEHAGQVVTHQKLLREIWGATHVDDSQYLRLYVKQLRRKLEATPGSPHYILTEPRIGYRLLDEEPATHKPKADSA